DAVASQTPPPPPPPLKGGGGPESPSPPPPFQGRGAGGGGSFVPDPQSPNSAPFLFCGPHSRQADRTGSPHPDQPPTRPLDNLQAPAGRKEAAVPRQKRDEDIVACPYCGEEIYVQAERCPHCETYISEEDAPALGRGKPWWLYIGALACLYAVYRWITGW